MGDSAKDNDVDEDRDCDGATDDDGTMTMMMTMMTMVTMATTATGRRQTTMMSTMRTTMSTVDDVDDDVDDNNLPPRVGKRNDGCDETKPEEEETVTDSVAIHTTIKQITVRGGGRWQRLQRRRRR